MVTISEEFVANEQMNNCNAADQASGAQTVQTARPPSQPASVSASAPSSDSEDGEDVGSENGKAEPESLQQQPKMDNHQASKNQRSKQKRNQSNEAQKPAAKPKNEVAPTAAAAAGTPVAPSAPQQSSRPAATGVSNNSHPVPPATGNSATPFPHLEAVSRVLALPIVDSGVNIVTGVYSKVKNVNPVLQWSLGTAEGAFRSSLERSLSLLGPLSGLRGPISVVDSLLCRGLDMVEYSVPIITLPPELMVNAGRDYMSTRVVAPVLRMTASNAHLADTIAARALDSADRYVDKYLPGDAATENGDVVGAGSVKGGAALQRADRLSRKLQRRITRRTLLEARALRKDTENTLHTLVFFAETLVKDPRAFVEQCRAVWNHLSENEPGNQVPPETLEERLALLVREVARRVVHLANYTAARANTQTVSIVANHVIKSVQAEGAKVMTFAQSQLDRVHMSQVLDEVNSYTHLLLERLARILAGLRSSSHSLERPFPHAGTNNIAIVN